jgi:hypothetical protein
MEVPGSVVGGCRIQGADEFRIREHLILHVRVLAPYRTMHNLRAGAGGDFARCADCNRAIDDCQRGLVSAYVSHRFADKIINLKRVANMHYIGVLNLVNRTFYVDSNSLIALRKDSQEGFAHLSQADNQHGPVVTHELSSCGAIRESFHLRSASVCRMAGISLTSFYLVQPGHSKPDAHNPLAGIPP